VPSNWLLLLNGITTLQPRATQLFKIFTTATATATATATTATTTTTIYLFHFVICILLPSQQNKDV